MKATAIRVGFVLLALSVLCVALHATPATAQPQPVDAQIKTKKPSECPDSVIPKVLAGFPGRPDGCTASDHAAAVIAQIDDVKRQLQTRAPNDPQRQDLQHKLDELVGKVEFTVTLTAADGARLEVVVNGDVKVLHTTKITPHGDRVESQGIVMALLFWCFAGAAVGGALFVITRRNLIAAVMGMVGSFMGIAAVYMMLYANFLAVVQMLVYAGAIMVLFVFVIMVLNRPEDEPVAPSGRIGQVIGGGAIIYLVGRLVFLLIDVKAPEASLAAPPQVQLPAISAAPGKHVDWGGVESVGNDLFGNGLFAFEAISILLLIAVVGAIAIARPLSKSAEHEETAQ